MIWYDDIRSNFCYTYFSSVSYLKLQKWKINLTFTKKSSIHGYIHTVSKSSAKSDHDDFFPSNHFTKIGEFWFSQMHVFIYLGGISTSNWWNISCREGFEVKFIHNEVFKLLNINMSIFLPKMGYFQKHITSSSVHLRQVFQHWKIGWTLFFQL